MRQAIFVGTKDENWKSAENEKEQWKEKTKIRKKRKSKRHKQRKRLTLCSYVYYNIYLIIEPKLIKVVKLFRSSKIDTTRGQSSTN